MAAPIDFRLYLKQLQDLPWIGGYSDSRFDILFCRFIYSDDKPKPKGPFSLYGGKLLEGLG
jgi:hypothetical protein